MGLLFIKMAFKYIILTCLLAVAQSVPYIGHSLPLLGISRIVGGEDARKGEFPHQVSLQWGPSSESPLQHFCGGSILNDQWILTAGHCVNAVPSYGYFCVKAGKHNIKIKEQTEQTSEVLRSYVHDRYPGSVAPFDIALLRLKTPLKLNDNVKTIDLPRNSEPKGTIRLSGWGSTSRTHNPIYPDVLQKVNLTILDNASCKRQIQEIAGEAPVADSNICTGPSGTGLSACSGDSGGPLINVDKTTNRAEVIGIVSWGIMPCGLPRAPSVYTRVSSYLTWIKSTIGNSH